MATLTASGVTTSSGQLDGYYTGSTANNTSYPLGSVINMYVVSGAPTLNSAVTPYTRNNSSTFNFFFNGWDSPQVAIAGTWRSRGIGDYNSCYYRAMLLQRVA